MRAEDVLAIAKEDIPQRAESLTPEDVCVLVPLLAEKDDAYRYPALLLLQQYAEFASEGSAYFEEYIKKLNDENSFQRSIGALMIAANARWVNGETMALTIDRYLDLLDDEKPTTVRLCIQGLQKIVPHHIALQGRIAKALISLDILLIRETMRKPVLTDILNILVPLKKQYGCELADGYITSALSGGILDAKTKKAFLALLG